jgi:hypothetical protein
MWNRIRRIIKLFEKFGIRNLLKKIRFGRKTKRAFGIRKWFKIKNYKSIKNIICHRWKQQNVKLRKWKIDSGNLNHKNENSIKNFGK